MKKMISFFSGFVSENGQASSKRLVGVMCAAFLCWTLYSNHTEQTDPSEALVYSVASLAFGCLGLTSAEKIFRKDENKD
jgi:hypothetical protein